MREETLGSDNRPVDVSGATPNVKIHPRHDKTATTTSTRCPRGERLAEMGTQRSSEVQLLPKRPGHRGEDWQIVEGAVRKPQGRSVKSESVLRGAIGRAPPERSRHRDGQEQ